jgi:hypothetical protein
MEPASPRVVPRPEKRMEDLFAARMAGRVAAQVAVSEEMVS